MWHISKLSIQLKLELQTHLLLKLTTTLIPPEPIEDFDDSTDLVDTFVYDISSDENEYIFN